MPEGGLNGSVSGVVFGQMRSKISDWELGNVLPLLYELK